MTLPTPPRRLFYFSLRICTYSTLTFVTMLGIVAPTLRLLTAAVLLGYAAYMAVDTLTRYSRYEKDHREMKKSIRWAVIENGQDIAYFALAVIIGIGLSC